MTTMIRMVDPERYNALIQRHPTLDTGDVALTLSLADWLRERQARYRRTQPAPVVAEVAETAESLANRCLAYLASNPPATARQISDAFGVHRSITTSSLFRLEQRGAVVSEKAELPNGRAVNVYSLTKEEASAFNPLSPSES